MCGIGGFSENNTELGLKINSSISHRGPDDSGVWSDSSFTLNHTLLSIRANKEKSKQPWTKTGSPWVLVFNGQIYNTESLKKEISNEYKNEELDTSILYALIEKVGWNFISHIEGMFAIGLYNTKEQKLRLYRDKSGQKNIYYTHELPQFAFCSEIKGILIAVDVPRESDKTAVSVATSIGYIPGDRTLFANIRKVRPGEIVTRESSGLIKREFYKSNSEEFLNSRSENVIKKTVRNHLLSKRRVAINLSGGMDSSLLLHEMKDLGHDMHTYTTRFISEDNYLNKDADLALRLSKDYGTDHNEIEITSKIYKDNIIIACETLEEPNYNISLATYLEVAKNEGINGDNNRVILSGDGGDEVFGGYPSYKQSLYYSNLIKKITPLGFNSYKLLRDGEYWNYNDPIEKWLRMKFFFLERSDRKIKTLKFLRENLPPDWAKRTHDPVRDFMYLDRLFWLSGENFIRSDKLYMSESLELRSPLSYQPLRNYFDNKLSFKEYFQNGTNKYYLRELYRNKLPNYIIDRKDKTGWRSPIKAWWNKEYKDLFCEAFRNAPKGSEINWDKMVDEVQKSDSWPGKYFHLYLSLAVLSKKFNLPL